MKSPETTLLSHKLEKSMQGPGVRRCVDWNMSRWHQGERARKETKRMSGNERRREGYMSDSNGDKITRSKSRWTLSVLSKQTRGGGGAGWAIGIKDMKISQGVLPSCCCWQRESCQAVQRLRLEKKPNSPRPVIPSLDHSLLRFLPSAL